MKGLAPVEFIANPCGRIEDRGFDARLISTESVTPPPKRLRSRAAAGLVTTTVAVQGMTCGSCTRGIESGFKGVDGVVDITVSLTTERAVVVHDVTKVSAEKVVDMWVVPGPNSI